MKHTLVILFIVSMYSNILSQDTLFHKVIDSNTITFTNNKLFLAIDSQLYILHDNNLSPNRSSKILKIIDAQYDEETYQISTIVLRSNVIDYVLYIFDKKSNKWIVSNHKILSIFNMDNKDNKKVIKLLDYNIVLIQTNNGNSIENRFLVFYPNYTTEIFNKGEKEQVVPIIIDE